MSNPTPVSRALAQMNIPHREFRHPGPVRSLEQAAAERGQQPEQIIRSLLFRIAADEFVMVLMAGPRQIDWKALRRYLGEKRLTTASEEEMLRVTGYQRGAVAPFGLPAPLRTLADESIFVPNEVSLGSGVRGTTIILSSADLRQALGDIEIVNLGKG
jgi:Cys-tRNA(Pro) deacylase